MRKIGKKTVGLIVLIITVAFILIKSCGDKGEKEYIYEKASKGDVRKTITVTGELDVVNPTVIMCMTNGIIEKLYVDFNEHVSKGQLLIKLDSTGVEQRVMKAASLLESARLEIESSRRELEGKANLYKDNLISKRAMEQAEIEYSAVVSKYKQVKIDYDMAVKEREYTRIYSPVSGIVIAVYKKNNDPVSQAVPLILLAPTLEKMVLTISVDESDIGNVKTGQLVQFTVSAYPDKKFFGTISQVRINPVKTGGLVTYQALVMCNNDGMLLKPGMTATATVVIEERKNVVLISNQAFMISPETIPAGDVNRYLWKREGVMGSKSYKRISVKTGLVGDMATEIIEGVKEGDDIMVKIKESK